MLLQLTDYVHKLRNFCELFTIFFQIGYGNFICPFCQHYVHSCCLFILHIIECVSVVCIRIMKINGCMQSSIQNHSYYWLTNTDPNLNLQGPTNSQVNARMFDERRFTDFQFIYLASQWVGVWGGRGLLLPSLELILQCNFKLGRGKHFSFMFIRR